MWTIIGGICMAVGAIAGIGSLVANTMISKKQMEDQKNLIDYEYNTVGRRQEMFDDFTEKK